MSRWVLSQLFPDGVLVEVATAADEDESLLDSGELALMSAMIPSRRREFTAGRNTARRVLSRLGLPQVPLLRPAGARDVAWPAGSVGTISHTSGLCAVACAPASLLRSIGLDVEQAGPLGSDIVAAICLPGELVAMASLDPPGRADWPRLFFAMKEAAYKAWFPVTRRLLDFHEMEVRVNHLEGSYDADVGGVILRGRFGWDNRYVYAGAWYPRQ